MDDTMASFLYYLFPRELFIRALSLLESNDMFIYTFQPDSSLPLKESSTTKTFDDKDAVTKTSSDLTSSSKTDPDNERDSNEAEGKKEKEKEIEELVNDVYNEEDQFLHRLIVKPENTHSPPISVDLLNWFCSCSEFNELFHEELKKGEELSNCLIKEIDDMSEFSNDKFSQLDAHSLSRQKYFKFDKCLCHHLLAYSIILRSSPDILRYFTLKNCSVFHLRIDNLDEWLKLHINIVI